MLSNCADQLKKLHMLFDLCVFYITRLIFVSFGNFVIQKFVVKSLLGHELILEIGFEENLAVNLT